MGLPKKRNSLNKRVKNNKKRKSRLNNRRKSKKGGSGMEVPSEARSHPGHKAAFDAHLKFVWPEMKLRSIIKKLNDSGIKILNEGEDESALYTTLLKEHLTQKDDPEFEETSDLMKISKYFINTTVSDSDERRFPKSAEILEKINGIADYDKKRYLLTEFFTIFLA